ncbi:peptide-methionine (S)-S-oxide reductase MsrA [Candidatus Woesebacteria bacterium]|nr:peptide-methionine (S)-S-oxide reductase MsrA [Candidatus Woesebacteria bacterium]
MSKQRQPAQTSSSLYYETATFAGGCFWCLESIVQETKGVIDAVDGYAGGKETHPTYEDVYLERTGHRESVQVTFDSKVISYQELLAIFWQNINPTDAGGQFFDRGHSYTTAIFYHNAQQKKIAEQSKKDLETSGRFDKPIVTEILPYTTFYKAEEYHQDYYKKSALHYNAYKKASGREAFKKRIWEEIKKRNQHT